MNEQLIPFGPGAQVFIVVYLLSLLAIGALAYRARTEHSLQDFYLAGRGIGLMTLLLTLYSTQYSGNTLLGFSGKTYRIGLSWGMCIHFMTAIVVVYLFFAPQLHRLAKRHEFITPADFLTYRFRDRRLSLIASVVMVVAIANFLLAQLMAMGNALQGLTSADPATAYTVGVVVLALIIVVYETLGGFRAVAWTDVIQGSVLLLGFVLLFLVVLHEFGPITDAIETIHQASPEKVERPTASRLREWWSYIVLVGLGGTLYPQSIQRIYAAKSATTLRKSLQVMAWLPLTTTVVAVLVGIYGLANYPGISDADSDTILTVVCSHIQRSSNFGYWLVVVLFSAVLAAIMSTADSVLLSISSMVTKDVYAVHINPAASQHELTKFGKRVSWTLMAILVVAAIQLRGTTLIALLDKKFDILVQLAPAFLLGVRWPRMNAIAARWGLITGLAVALGLSLAGWGKIAGVHAGLFGLAANLAIVITLSLAHESKGASK